MPTQQFQRQTRGTWNQSVISEPSSVSQPQSTMMQGCTLNRDGHMKGNSRPHGMQNVEQLPKTQWERTTACVGKEHERMTQQKDTAGIRFFQTKRTDNQQSLQIHTTTMHQNTQSHQTALKGSPEPRAQQVQMQTRDRTMDVF